jgi:hypothetical protein
MQSTAILKRIASSDGRLFALRRIQRTRPTHLSIIDPARASYVLPTSKTFHSHSYHAQRSTRPVLAPASAMEDDCDYYYDDEVEKITAECIQELLPHYSSPQGELTHRSLDLELGEEEGEYDSWEDDDLSTVAEEAEPSSTPPKPNKLSAVELLSNFDPQNPPSSDNLEDLELWLECEAQTEAVSRYQKVIDSARQRKDYSSLSLVQRQVLWWFQPLSDAIEKKQRDYMLKTQDKGEKGDSQRAAKRYGPYLCILPPGKLAVIAAHAAIMHSLTTGGQHGKDGIPFVSMVKRLGEAVEEEVVIQRVLHKRFKETQERDRIFKLETIDDNKVEQSEEECIPENEEGSTLENEEEQEKPDSKHSSDGAQKWAYSASHLQNYLDEIKRTKPKKRRVVSYAIWRARHILEKEEEWSVRDKIQLGAVLFQVLLENAKLKDGDTYEPAFLYEKRWTRKSKQQSFVILNPRLQEMIVSDKLQSFAASTTRQKPMIVPPKPWTKPDDGGYLWLKVDLMRYHGCNTQRVRETCFFKNVSFFRNWSHISCVVSTGGFRLG